MTDMTTTQNLTGEHFQHLAKLLSQHSDYPVKDSVNAAYCLAHDYIRGTIDPDDIGAAWDDVAEHITKLAARYEGWPADRQNEIEPMEAAIASAVDVIELIDACVKEGVQPDPSLQELLKPPAPKSGLPALRKPLPRPVPLT